MLIVDFLLISAKYVELMFDLSYKVDYFQSLDKDKLNE